MRCCFFRQFAFRFREKRSQNIEESLNDVQWSETKKIIILIYARWLSCVTWRGWLARVLMRETILRMSVQVLNFFPRFFFFAFFFFYSSFYYFFVNRKDLFVDLSRRTMLVRSAGSKAGFDIFPVYLTTRTGRFFLLIDWNNLLQIVSPIRHHDHWLYDHFAEWRENTQACHADKFFSL